MITRCGGLSQSFLLPQASFNSSKIKKYFYLCEVYFLCGNLRKADFDFVVSKMSLTEDGNVSVWECFFWFETAL